MPETTGSSECVIALDVGGTGMKGALLDRSLRPLLTLRLPTPRADGADAVVKAIAVALTTLAQRAAEGGLTVRHAGVVTPGIVDEDRGLVVYAANLGWSDLPLAALMRERTGLSVSVGHDVRAGGEAEYALGAARGKRDVLFVAIGTGIATALVCDGRTVRAGGYAGELGHVVVDRDGLDCACGARGCLETVASAAAVAAGYSARSGRLITSAAEVAARLQHEDRDALEVWDLATEALASALVTTATLLAPEMVVLGGGLAEAGDLLLHPLRARLDERLTFQRRPEVVRAELGDTAGCLGAGLLAWRSTPV